MWADDTSDACRVDFSASTSAARAGASRASRRGPVTGVKGMADSSFG